MTETQAIAIVAWKFITARKLLVFYIVAVMIDQLPAATAQSSSFYRWFFGVVQILAANWTRGKRGFQGTLASKQEDH